MDQLYVILRSLSLNTPDLEGVEEQLFLFLIDYPKEQRHNEDDSQLVHSIFWTFGIDEWYFSIFLELQNLHSFCLGASKLFL